MRVQQVPNSPYFIHYDDEGFCCIYLIYAVNEKALMPSVMFAIYIDGIYYANRGMYVDDATTINCEYSLNEEVLSHYDPNFVKGL